MKAAKKQAQEALGLLISSNRFDLIFKYLFAKAYFEGNQVTEEIYREFYLESIRAFNDFKEPEPLKESSDDFLNAFLKLAESLKSEGFLATAEAVPVTANGTISNGAHRVSIAASLALKIQVARDPNTTKTHKFGDYTCFLRNEMNQDFADLGALEFLKLKKNAFVVNLHSIVELNQDQAIEKLLEKYGRIYYKKHVHLNLNGYVNLKKASYGPTPFSKGEEWLGTAETAFAGAREHARESFHKDRPLRAYLYIADSIEKALEAKAAVRSLLKKDKTPIHISDTPEEALFLAQSLFNDRSIELLNRRPFHLETRDFDEALDSFQSELLEGGNFDLQIAVTGSGPLAAYGLRKANDLDIFCLGSGATEPKFTHASSHRDQIEFYDSEIERLILDPRNYFYYRGFKFVSLENIRKMKTVRNEDPKDLADLALIGSMDEGVMQKYIEMPLATRSYLWGLIRKEKFSAYRALRFRDYTLFKYRSKKRRKKKK